MLEEQIKTKDELFLEAKNNVEKYLTNDIKISYSEFSKYSECGHRHLIEKFLKLSTEPPSIHLIFGNSVHLAIESGVKFNLELEKRITLFEETFLKEMMDKMINSPDYAFVKMFLEQGINILKSLKIEKIFEKYELIGVEIPLYEKMFKNYFFKGFIDLVLKYKDSGRYLIIDWKTSGEPWDVSKKKKNEVFMSQMRFYKYFYSTKYSIPIELIDCKYVVLNRLKMKNCPELGFGEIQSVDIFASEEHIKYSLEMISNVVSEIHINSHFPKAKFINKKSNCFFCPFKKDFNFCNSDPFQYKELLYQHYTKKIFE